MDVLGRRRRRDRPAVARPGGPGPSRCGGGRRRAIGRSASRSAGRRIDRLGEPSPTSARAGRSTGSDRRAAASSSWAAARSASSWARTGSSAATVVGGQAGDVVVPLEHVDVEVARWAGELAERAEVVRGPRQHVGAGAPACRGASTERVRRTATRNSWRNSGSRSSIVPGRLASIERARWASTSRNPSSARSSGSSGMLGSLSWPAGSTPAAAIAIATTSPSISVAPLAQDEVGQLGGLLLVAGELGDLDEPAVDRRRARWSARRGSSATATILPSRLRRTACRVVVVRRSTGSRARTSMTSASRARNGPGGRSEPNAGRLDRPAAGRPPRRRRRGRARRHGGSSRSPARCSRPSNVSRNVAVLTTGAPTSSPAASSAAIEAAWVRSVASTSDRGAHEGRQGTRPRRSILGTWASRSSASTSSTTRPGDDVLGSG